MRKTVLLELYYTGFIINDNEWVNLKMGDSRAYGRSEKTQQKYTLTDILNTIPFRKRLHMSPYFTLLFIRPANK